MSLTVTSLAVIPPRASEVVLNYAWRDVNLIPRRTLPPQALVLCLTPLLDERGAAALLDLRARGFDLVVIEVSPVPFVHPGKTELDELKTVFGELVATDDGRPVAGEISRFDELFGTKADGPLPDIVIQWRPRHRVPAVRSDRVGEVPPLTVVTGPPLHDLRIAGR